MRTKIYYIYTLIALLFIAGCGEEKILSPLEHDSTPPGKVIVETVVNGPGEATIEYSLPNDEDLLYVKASYVVNSREMEVKASYYNKQVILHGFNEVKPYEVAITCVDRSDNEGEAVIVQVDPEEAPVFQVYKSLAISADWGGVKYTWENNFNAPVVISLLAQDSLGTMQPLEWVYTESEVGEKSLRGFDPVDKLFGAVVRDRFDNFSDTLFSNQIPFFEEEIPFNESNLKVLDNDSKRNSWSGSWRSLFDSNNYTYVALETAYPQIVSFDLRAKVKLSRFILWSRIGNNQHYYGLGNAQKFRLYGALELPASADLADWELMGTYDIKRPSGLPFTADLTTEDKAYVDNGFENEVSIEASEVRYIRIVIDKTFGNTQYSYTGDLKCFGQILENF